MAGRPGGLVSEAATVQMAGKKCYSSSCASMEDAITQPLRKSGKSACETAFVPVRMDGCADNGGCLRADSDVILHDFS